VTCEYPLPCANPDFEQNRHLSILKNAPIGRSPYSYLGLGSLCNHSSGWLDGHQLPCPGTFLLEDPITQVSVMHGSVMHGTVGGSQLLCCVQPLKTKFYVGGVCGTGCLSTLTRISSNKGRTFATADHYKTAGCER
jgi:hypothetical protein